MLRVEPVETIRQVMLVRGIYNENLDALATIPLEPRSYEDQLKWWEDLDKGRVRLWLHYDGAYLIGFSMLTYRKGFHTPLFAIAKEHQGKGYAHWFIRHYITEAQTPLAGQQLVSNSAIRHLNKKHGWTVLYMVGGVEYLYHPGKTFENICAYHKERSS